MAASKSGSDTGPFGGFLHGATMKLNFVPVGGIMGGCPMKKGDTAALQLPSGLIEQVKTEAKRSRVSVPRLIAQSMAQIREDREDLRDIRAAKKRNAKPLTLAETKKALGLDA